MYDGRVILKSAGWCLVGALLAAWIAFSGGAGTAADIGRFVFFNLMCVALILTLLGMYIGGRTH